MYILNMEYVFGMYNVSLKTNINNIQLVMGKFNSEEKFQWIFKITTKICL